MVCHSQLKKRETENKRKEHDDETGSIVSSGEGCFEGGYNEVFELGGSTDYSETLGEYSYRVMAMQESLFE